jgi:hypothetical protein
MTRAPWILLGMGLLPLLLLPLAGAQTNAPTSPQPGDHFSFYEVTSVDQGFGNYTGYVEHTWTNGTRTMDAVAVNGTVNATYQDTAYYANNSGGSQTFRDSGAFTFSDRSYRYVHGTDNQSGYSNPFVWFLIDSTLGKGGSFTLLNTPMTVTSTDCAFPLASSATGWVRTICGEGNGSYLRQDSYGRFTATYQWIANFDPSTGYIVGYNYTEQDHDGTGDGFTYTDVLSITSSSYAPPSTSPPPPVRPNPPPVAGGFPLGGLLLGVLVVVVLVVVVVLLASRARRGPPRTALPRHAASGPMAYAPPMGPAPPPISLTPTDQPAIQQIVLRETVKVPCRYCGTLIDSTATACPKCGAPRT